MSKCCLCLLMIILLASMGLISCTSAQPAAPALEVPTLEIPTPDARFPLAQPLSEAEIMNIDDEKAQTKIIEAHEREAARSGSGSVGRILCPRIIPRHPAQYAPGWVDMIAVSPGQPFTGYINVAASVKGYEEHDFLLMLLVDYRQVPFELGGNLATAHLLRLPSGEVKTFPFRLPEPLEKGYHELLVIMHDDPFNIYATRGVLEKKRLGLEGKCGFSDAAGRHIYSPTGIRNYVVVGVGEETKAAWAKENFDLEPCEPRKTDWWNSPLSLRLTDDETDALIRKEPAVVAGSSDPLYAFSYNDSAPAESPLAETTAALVAILDDRQVRINGQEALFFRTQVGQRYRFPLQIEWPEYAMDGKVHSLYFSIPFGCGHEWRQDQQKWMGGRFSSTFFEEAVMVVPERSLIEYNEGP